MVTLLPRVCPPLHRIVRYARETDAALDASARGLSGDTQNCPPDDMKNWPLRKEEESGEDAGRGLESLCCG
jgi:hypothetical protein